MENELPGIHGLNQHYRFGKGICIGCGIPMPGTRLKAPRCHSCNGGDRSIYHTRKEHGLCTRCFLPAAPGRVLCVYHVEYAAKYGGRPISNRWGFDRLHAQYEAAATEAAKNLDDLWSMDGEGDEDTLLDLVFEVEEGRDRKLSALLHVSGWSREEYLNAASGSIVLGDGRVVRKAPGVVVKRVG